MLKRLVKDVAAVPWRLLPFAVQRRAVEVIAHANTRGEPRAAMRRLLQLESLIDAHVDQTALRYEGDGVHVKHRLMRYHDFFVTRVRSGDRVLDIGSGYGAVAHSVASGASASVTGIDMDADNVDKARRLFHHPALQFVRGRAPEDLPDQPFDVIIMSNVLEHIDQRVAFIQQVQRRLHPRRWLLRVPMIDRDWRVPLRRELGLAHFGDPTHFTEYTRESFEAEMVAAGLTVSHLQVNWGEIWAEARP